MLASFRLWIAAACALAIVAGVLLYAATDSLAIAIVFALAAAIAVGLVVGEVALGPARRLIAAARTVAGGDLKERVSPRPSGELGELTDAFNQMAESLERLVAAASEERNRLMAALNSSITAVVAVTVDGRIAFANAAAQGLFQRGQEELVDSPFVWVMPDDRVVEALRASREEGRRETLIVERPNRQYLQAITTPIVGGGDWAALVVFHDLSDVKRVEQVRRDFVANVSHELRTPLASIKSVIETLEAGALKDEKAAAEFLARADAEVDRLVVMVEELLELSRIESGDVPLAREPVDVGGILAEAVERLRPQAEKQGLSLALEATDDLPAVSGDADRLEGVVVNLIGNAIKFTPSGGSIRVSARGEGDALRVSISDTGVGIAPEDLSRIFERFYKVDRARGGAGSGLGLAVAKHTIEAHGGTIRADSEPERGSTFTFTLPTAPIAAERRAAS